MSLRAVGTALCAASLSAAFCSPAVAQEYPVKPVRMIIPFAPGGTTDIVGRLLGQKLGENLGQQVIVENRAGAGGTVGSAIAAKSPADGYTIMLGVVSPLAIAVGLYGAKLPYNPATDFAPISLVTKVPQVFAVHPSVPVRNVKELIALAKRSPDKLSYASAGNGSTNHLVTELFKSASGIQIAHIPYKSAGPASVAAVSGEVDMVVAAPPALLTHIRSNRLRPLAVSSATRSPALPDVPTVMESGFPGFDATAWYAMVAPAGTPRAHIERLHSALVRTLKAPEVEQRMVAEGARPESSTPDELGTFMRAEIVRWEKAVKISGARVD
jgi:tripartite-type tricarboxylate transporter receptor subunit TctC